MNTGRCPVPKGEPEVTSSLESSLSVSSLFRHLTSIFFSGNEWAKIISSQFFVESSRLTQSLIHVRIHGTRIT